MESLVRAVVHDNSNLRAHLKGLEINESYVNVPATENTRAPPTTVHPHVATSSEKEKKPAKLLTKLLSPV